jgi:heme-degrading monooxygenase HmoA
VIARIWHGRTSLDKSDEYLAFLNRRALPDYRGTAGNIGAFVLRRIDGDVAHFLTVSHWESLSAIEAFAGHELLRAKYYPEDVNFLLEFEPFVEHYELYS